MDVAALSPYWIVEAPWGTCLIQDFLEDQSSHPVVYRLCTHRLTPIGPIGPCKVRRLYSYELPTCARCRSILLNMKADGVR
jgi:hypothetical protein